MAALASAAEIPPGGEGAIKASVHTRGRSGVLSKTVTVETSDPAHRRIHLMLKAKVIVEAGFQPRNINLGRLSIGETVTKGAHLIARDPTKVKLKSIDVVSEVDGLRAKLVKTDGRDGVEVTYKGTKVGAVRARLKIGTTSEKRPTLDLMVRGIVLGNWEVLPRSVSFPHPEKGGDPVRRSLRIKARNKTSFRVTKAVDESGSVATKITKSADGFTIDLALNKVPENRRGIIKITTNDPSERVIEARYFVRSERRPLPHRPIETLKQRVHSPNKRVPAPPRED